MLNQLSQWKKGGEGCVCWDTISLMCQHVATLQFVSSAETDSAYSGQHPCFGPDWFIQFCHTWRWIIICVSLWLRKQRQRFAQGQPKGYFETKVFELLLNHAKSIIPMKERWGRLRMLRYDKFNVPTCGNIVVCQQCRERQPLWTGHDGLNLTGLDQCHGVRSCHKFLPRLTQKNCFLHSLPSKFDPWVYILLFDEGDFCRYAFSPKQAFLDRKQGSRFSQGQPKVYFQMKELDRTAEPIARINVEWKVEKAERAKFNMPTCGNIGVWKLRRERQPLWNSHDGLNLRRLDQCHGVRSHGTSSSQGWRKRIVFYTVYRLNLIHEFTSFFSTKVIFAGMPKKTFPRKQAFVDRKQGPRFSPGQPKGYYQMKELDRTTEAFARMNAAWKVEKAERAEFNVPTCGNIAVCQQCRGRQRL